MGKAQKKKAMRRHNPIRVPDSHLPAGLAAAASTSTKKDSILPIFTKLESSDATDRAWACAAVSNLIYNDPSTRRLLQGKNIVGALITRLTDSEDSVIVEAAGALRNLCIDGGYDICAEMYNKNILPALTAFVPKISASLAVYLSGQGTSPMQNPSIVFQLAENTITLFWCLSETSNKALNAINNIGLVPFLMSALTSRARLPPHVVTAAAQCAYVLSDDNTPAIEALRADASHISTLLAIAQDSTLANDDQDIISLRVLSCGILKNISPLPSQKTPVDLDRTVVLPLLVPVISSVSLLDASNRVTEVASQPLVKKPPELKNTPAPDHKSSGEVELERIEGQLRTVQLALEILTSVCASLPDPEPEEGGDEAQMEEDDDVDGEDAPRIKDDEDEEDAHASAGTTSTLLSTLTLPLIALARPVPLSFPPVAFTTPSIHPPTTSVLSAIHVRALECLNNLFLKMSSAEDASAAAATVEGAKGVWGEIWSVLGAVGRPGEVLNAGKVQEKRAEMWSIGAGVLWGLARIARGRLARRVPEEEQVKMLMELCDTTTEDQIKVQCIGTLGCLAQHTGSIDANRVISTYILAFVATPKTAEPTLQAASEIIDIYTDEEWAYDVNFRQGKFLVALTDALGGVRKVVRSIDQRKPGGKMTRRWADGIVQNLGDFVKYRRGLKV